MTAARCSSGGAGGREGVRRRRRRPGRVCCSRWASSRPAWSRRAGALRATSSQGRAVRSVSSRRPRVAVLGRVRRAGGSSRMTWALVPEMPNDGDPGAADALAGAARRRLRCSSRTAPAVPVHVRTRAVRRAGCAAGCRVRRARIILMMPATPAAAWVCPMLDLTEPSHSGRSSGRSWPYVASSACASIGVAEGGAGAVRLHHVDVGGGEPGVGQRLPDDPLLGGAVGGGQAVGGAVLVDGRAPHHGQHAVAGCGGRRRAAPRPARRRPRPSRCRRRRRRTPCSGRRARGRPGG